MSEFQRFFGADEGNYAVPYEYRGMMLTSEDGKAGKPDVISEIKPINRLFGVA